LRRTVFGKEKLVNNDVVRVDLVRGQLLDEPLGLVKRQELRYADADEGCLFLLISLQGGLRHNCRQENRLTGSLNCVFTSVITARMLSSLENRSSVLPIPPPIKLDI
jgi:uncharacterized radical SAM superfamily Fe-S cluster-containing enzyme